MREEAVAEEAVAEEAVRRGGGEGGRRGRREAAGEERGGQGGERGKGRREGAARGAVERRRAEETSPAGRGGQTTGWYSALVIPGVGEGFKFARHEACGTNGGACSERLQVHDLTEGALRVGGVLEGVEDLFEGDHALRLLVHRLRSGGAE